MMHKEFWKAAFVRALRTFCQAAVAVIGSAALLSQIRWKEALSSSALAALLSVLTSIATGLPEADEDPQQAGK